MKSVTLLSVEEGRDLLLGKSARPDKHPQRAVKEKKEQNLGYDSISLLQKKKRCRDKHAKTFEK
jgi:hypothetical protein